MIGIHIILSKDWINDDNKPFIPDHIIITMITSALLYRFHYGNILLYTDKAMKKYLTKIGAIKFWNSVDSSTYNSIPFFASSNGWKGVDHLFLLATVNKPFVYLNSDCLFFKQIKWKTENVFYEEYELDYPNFPDLNDLCNIAPIESLSYDVKPINTSVFKLTNYKVLNKVVDYYAQYFNEADATKAYDYDECNVRGFYFYNRMLAEVLVSENIEYSLFKDKLIQYDNTPYNYYKNFNNTNIIEGGNEYIDEYANKVEHFNLIFKIIDTTFPQFANDIYRVMVKCDSWKRQTPNFYKL